VDVKLCFLFQIILSLINLSSFVSAKQIASKTRNNISSFCPLMTHIKDLTYVFPCIIYENDERYQFDATILFIINNSTCFRHLYAHLQEYRLYTTAYGVQHCKRELCVSGWLHFMLFIVLCNCWLRLCCMLYWVLVLHNTCYAHWSGWKCRGGAGACSVWLR
jgi:hypothetical protein